MEIFLDSANFREIEHWLRQGVVDGVTTNPSIMLKDGVYGLEEGARRLCTLLGNRPVSVEVTTNDAKGMLEQGRTFARWAPNVVVKIPVVNECGDSCLGVIHTLSREGVPVNTTAILSFNQAILMRVAREIGWPDGDELLVSALLHDVGKLVLAQAYPGYPAKVLVGSIRAVIDVQSAALAGAHIVTIPPQFLSKMVDHKYGRETVRQFNQDAEKALAQISQYKTAAQ